jgi:hypothetical protein
MNFAIPRNNPAEMILYIWKIIDLPTITEDDLLFTISFDLFLLSPQKAKELIHSSIENNFLEKHDKDILSLSRNLKKNLENWQLERKEAILTKIIQSKKKDKALNNFQKDKVSIFNTLLKAFLDRGTINRTLSISEEDFNIIEFDFERGFIKADVSGSKKESYRIEININNRELIHNCHDFQTKRAENKKFCKHLAKLFLLLKEKKEESAVGFLREIAEHINNWKFLS